MVRSSPTRSNIRPLVLTAMAEGRPQERPPRRTPAVILPFPGCRVEPLPAPGPRPHRLRRIALAFLAAIFLFALMSITTEKTRKVPACAITSRFIATAI